MGDIIKLAIPFFFASIALEFVVLWMKGKLHYYRIADTINCLSCGSISQITDIFAKIFLYFVGYQYIQQNLSIQKLGVPAVTENWISWVVVFFAVDFLYYWFHRTSHSVAIVWATHVVHHQSEEYNLGVALRQSAFQNFFSWAFYVTLAFAGVPLKMFFVCMGINLLYQFWIHTRAIKKLGFFELFMNTPSHHRVHHGKNPKYCDKNHAGVFIIWDRMFGTFVEEDEEPVYGITVPLNSWNPIWANIGPMSSLFKEAFKAKNIQDFFAILFREPGYRPDYLGGPIKPVEIDTQHYEKFDTAVAPSLNIYVIVHFIAVIAAALPILEYSQNFLTFDWNGKMLVLFLSGFMLHSFMDLGGLLEMDGWSYRSEVARLVMVAAGSIYATIILPAYFYLAVGIAVFSLASIAWLTLGYDKSKFSLKKSTPYPLPI
jgi:sterol desaturase/sphingolipid hydroxylase (fatty acid hydroxylase superfamily)